MLQDVAAIDTQITAAGERQSARDVAIADVLGIPPGAPIRSCGPEFSIQLIFLCQGSLVSSFGISQGPRHLRLLIRRNC
jgi:hypothetical protein